MTTLRASPYSLAYGDTVQAIVAAINALGTSAFSEVNTVGASMEDVPTQMGAPYIDYTSSDLTTITMDWDALTTDAETNGNTVDVYKLEYSSDAEVSWT
jgi:hypothetical protein